MIICIDGPAAAGKGTIAQGLATKIGLPYLNSGYVYRALAHEVLCSRPEDGEPQYENSKTSHSTNPQSSVDIKDEADIAKFRSERFKLALDLCQRITPDLIASLSVENKLDGAEVAQMASIIGSDPAVREALMQVQRSFVRHGPCGDSLVTDGRDMGTVIFPEADHKFFLKASVKVRAYRRFLQLKSTNISYDYILRELKQRDDRDSERAISPLVPAEDAIVIDCTFLGINELENLMLSMIIGKDGELIKHKSN